MINVWGQIHLVLTILSFEASSCMGEEVTNAHSQVTSTYKCRQTLDLN